MILELPTIATLTQRAVALTAMLDDETERLARENPRDLTELVTNKQQLANEFNHAVQQLLSNKDHVRSAAREQREALRIALASFQESVLRNGALLLKLQRHKQDMLNMIADELHPGSRSQTSYAPGASSRPGRAPLAINAVI